MDYPASKISTLQEKKKGERNFFEPFLSGPVLTLQQEVNTHVTWSVIVC
jgi:hypothetical protein